MNVTFPLQTTRAFFFVKNFNNVRNVYFMSIFGIKKSANKPGVVQFIYLVIMILGLLEKCAKPS